MVEKQSDSGVKIIQANNGGQFFFNEFVQL